MEIISYKNEIIFWDKEAQQDYETVFRKINAKNVFAVCSKSAKERYGKKLFQNTEVSVTWFGDFSSNPVYEDVCKGVELFRKERYDVIVSIGGGSAIDVAKAILAFSQMDASKSYMEQEIKTGGISHLAVPTTAGTGSESTHFAVVYVNGEKKSISHESLLPDYALLEPVFLESLPVYQKKCTVLDALCQAIESYWSVKSTEESREYAKEAADILLGSLEGYVAGNEKVNARIIRAANLAGRAIDITQTTAAHAMSYKLTSLYGIPHGHAVAVCLPFVWEKFLTNAEACIDGRGENYLTSIMHELQELFGMDTAAHTIRAFSALLARLEINLNDCELGGNLEKLVSSVNVQRLSNFPIKLTEGDLRQIYEKAFAKQDKSESADMFYEVAVRSRSLKKKKFKEQKKLLSLNLESTDVNRRLEAAVIFHRCLEAVLEYPREAAALGLDCRMPLLIGNLVSYVKQLDAGLYYVDEIKKQLEQAGVLTADQLVPKLCAVMPVGEQRMYLYLRTACMYGMIEEERQLEELCALFGIQDKEMLKNVFDGLLYQFGLHEYHYFTAEEEERLRQILAEVPTLAGGGKSPLDYFKEVFRENAEEISRFRILCWQYLVKRNNQNYQQEYRGQVRKERVTLLEEAVAALKESSYALFGSALQEALSSQFSAENVQEIILAVKDDLDVIEKKLQTGGTSLRVQRQEDVLYVYHETTKWLQSEEDQRGLGVFIEIVQVKELDYGLQEAEFFGKAYRIPGDCERAENLYLEGFAKSSIQNLPYKVEISGKTYVFNTPLYSAERAEASTNRGKSKKKYLRKIKRSAMAKTEEKPFLKEVFRRILECKRRLVYTLKYKYKFTVDDKIVLFESYHGEHYNCNPRGIYEAMLRDERYLDYTFVWAFKEPEKYKFLEDNFSTVVVKSTSRKYYKYCASAKYIVLNLLLRPHITLKKEQTYIQTWHGKPIKTIGCGKRFETDPRRSLKDTYRHFSRNGKRITKLLSPSEAFTPIMGEAFHFTEQRMRTDIAETGYPRNDELFRYTEGDVDRIKQRLGVDPGKKVILYAPTWRELFSDYIEKKDMDVVLRVSDSIDFEKLHAKLGDDCIILFRAHHLDAEAMDISRYSDFIIDVTNYENVNDLYIISDLMISDYSGTIFDFGVLKRPMVFYMFDRELYTTKLQGVNIDLDELPGIFVEKEEELAEAIQKQLSDFRYDEKYERFNQKYNLYDDGQSGQRVIDLCMPDNVVHKTLTAQAVKKLIKKSSLFITKPLKRLKLNVYGVLREQGMIKDENSRRLLALKNKYQGQRCFLIGNGPSLKAEDLDMIADEVTFGCNMVYKMFDKTKWRPTYHFIVDIIYTKNLYREIKNNIKSPMITHNIAYRSMKQKPENITYVNTFSQEDYQIRGNMLAYYIPARATVMTFMIEMAVYMGFQEIYLLGTDCTNSFTSGHFGEEYVASDLDKVNLARARRTIGKPDLTLAELGEYRRERSIMAYQKIAAYADKKGVKIYNATRGGALEVFPRKRLEDVLHVKED